MVKYSIVVPIYNSENTLRRCIESVLCQDNTQYELILVDDGSTDASGQICDEYAQKYNQIRVVHKMNGGVSSARNAGIELAVGEYILFLDSDDEYLADALNNIVAGRADLIVFGKEIHKTNPQSDVLVECDEELIYSLNTATIGQLIGRNFFCVVWDKLFKMSIIKTHHLLFDEDLNFGEDYVFLCRYLVYCKDIYFSKSLLYRYYIGDSSSLSVAPILETMLKSNRRGVEILSSRYEGIEREKNIIKKDATSYIVEIYRILKTETIFKKQYKQLKAITSSADFRRCVLEEFVKDDKLLMWCFDDKPLVSLCLYKGWKLKKKFTKR